MTLPRSHLCHRSNKQRRRKKKVTDDDFNYWGQMTKLRRVTFSRHLTE
jgi:hypothetical protein